MINADGGLRQQKIWYAIFLETQQKVLRKLEILCNQVGVEKAIEEMDKIYDNWRDGKTKVIIDKYLKMEYNKNMNTEKNNDWIDFWDMFFGFDEKANSKQQNQEKPIKQEKPKTNELIELPSKQQIFR